MNALQVAKEVQKFEDKADAACSEPHLSWVNNLYIYPSTLSLKGYAGEKPRTIGVTVKLLNSDNDPNAPGLQVLSTHTPLKYFAFSLFYKSRCVC
jgi:hypothetical protein